MAKSIKAALTAALIVFVVVTAGSQFIRCLY